MLLTFTFTINPETQEAAFAGNVEPQVALQLLQGIVIQSLARRLQEEVKETKDVG